MSSSRNIVLHRKSSFHPTRKRVGFTPQFITTTYNEKGEELSKSYVDGNGRTVKELSNGFYSDYTYDSQGRKSLVNVSDGSSLAYSYVGDTNNIAELRHTDADGNLIQTREYSYNTAGQKVKDVIKDGNGVITNTYDYYYAEDGSISKVEKNAGGDIVQVEKTEMLPDGSKQVTVLSNSADYLFASVETYDKDGNMQTVRDLPVNSGNMNELLASLKITVPDNQG